MGFDIGLFPEAIEVEFDSFIDRTYYEFVCNYENEGSESVIQQTGEALRINLEPLAKLVPLEAMDDEEYLESNLQDTKELLNFVSVVREKVSQNLTVADNFIFEYSDDRKKWPLYFSSGKILEDLDVVIRLLQQYQQDGVKRVFFGIT